MALHMQKQYGSILKSDWVIYWLLNEKEQPMTAKNTFHLYLFHLI